MIAAALVIQCIITLTLVGYLFLCEHNSIKMGYTLVVLTAIITVFTYIAMRVTQ